MAETKETVEDIMRRFSGDPQMEAAAIGVEAEYFITNTRLGRYLIERAHSMRVAALEALATVDPTDAKAVREYQNAAKVTDLFVQWLDEAIASGQAAGEIIKAEEAEFLGS